MKGGHYREMPLESYHFLAHANLQIASAQAWKEIQAMLAAITGGATPEAGREGID